MPEGNTGPGSSENKPTPPPGTEQGTPVKDEDPKRDPKAVELESSSTEDSSKDIDKDKLANETEEALKAGEDPHEILEDLEDDATKNDHDEATTTTPDQDQTTQTPEEPQQPADAPETPNPDAEASPAEPAAETDPPNEKVLEREVQVNMNWDSLIDKVKNETTKALCERIKNEPDEEVRSALEPELKSALSREQHGASLQRDLFGLLGNTKSYHETVAKLAASEAAAQQPNEEPTKTPQAEKPESEEAPKEDAGAEKRDPNFGIPDTQVGPDGKTYLASEVETTPPPDEKAEAGDTEKDADLQIISDKLSDDNNLFKKITSAVKADASKVLTALREEVTDQDALNAIDRQIERIEAEKAGNPNQDAGASPADSQTDNDQTSSVPEAPTPSEEPPRSRFDFSDTTDDPDSDYEGRNTTTSPPDEDAEGPTVPKPEVAKEYSVGQYVGPLAQYEVFLDTIKDPTERDQAQEKYQKYLLGEITIDGLTKVDDAPVILELFPFSLDPEINKDQTGFISHKNQLALVERFQADRENPVVKALMNRMKDAIKETRSAENGLTQEQIEAHGEIYRQLAKNPNAFKHHEYLEYTRKNLGLSPDWQERGGYPPLPILSEKAQDKKTSEPKKKNIVSRTWDSLKSAIGIKSREQKVTELINDDAESPPAVGEPLQDNGNASTPPDGAKEPIQDNDDIPEHLKGTVVEAVIKKYGENSPEANEAIVEDAVHDAEAQIEKAIERKNEKLKSPYDNKVIEKLWQVKIRIGERLNESKSGILQKTLGTPEKRGDATKIANRVMIAGFGVLAAYATYRGFHAMGVEGAYTPSGGGAGASSTETAGPVTTDAAPAPSEQVTPPATTEAPTPTTASSAPETSVSPTTELLPESTDARFDSESDLYRIPFEEGDRRVDIVIPPDATPEEARNYIDLGMDVFSGDPPLTGAAREQLRQDIIDSLQQTVTDSEGLTPQQQEQLQQALTGAENYVPPTTEVPPVTPTETVTPTTTPETATPTTTVESSAPAPTSAPEVTASPTSTETPATTTAAPAPEAAPTTTMESSAPTTTPETAAPAPTTEAPAPVAPGAETPPVPQTPEQLQQQLETSFAGLQHEVQPGEGYWKIIQGYIDSADPAAWPEQANGVTKGDVIADMLTTFASENNVDLPTLHPGEILTPDKIMELKLTPDQLQVVTEALGTQDAQTYIEDVMPRFELVQDGQPLTEALPVPDAPAEPIVAPTEIPAELQTDWTNFDHQAVAGDTRSESYRDFFRDHESTLPGGNWSNSDNETSKATQLANLWTNFQERHGLEPDSLSIGEHVNFADWDKFTPEEQRVFLEAMNTTDYQNYVDNVIPDYDALNQDVDAQVAPDTTSETQAELPALEPETTLAEVPPLAEVFDANFTINHPGGSLSTTIQQQLASIDTFRNWPKQGDLNSLSAVLTDMLVDNSRAHGFDVNNVPAGTYSLADLGIQPDQLQNLMLSAVEQNSASEYISNVQPQYIEAKKGWS